MGIFDKYQPVGSAQPAQTGSVFSKYQPLPTEKPWYESVGNAVVGGMDAVAQAGAAAAGQVAKGAGNLAKVAGDNLSYIDPIANAQRISEATTGKGFGYTSPQQWLGNNISQGANAMADNAVKASEQGITGKNEAAQAFGKIYGDIGTAVGASALGGKSTGGFGGWVGNNVLQTGLSTAAIKGETANAADLGTGLALGGAFEGLGALGKVFNKGKKVSESLYDIAVPLNKKEAELVQKNLALGNSKAFKPRTTADTARELGIAGTEKQMGVQAVKKADEIFEQMVKPTLAKQTSKYSFTDAFKKIKDAIELESELGRKADLTDAYQALKDEYSSVTTMPWEKAQKVKSGLDKFTPEKAFKGKPIGSAYGEIKKMLADDIRQSTYNLLPDESLKNAYLDYGNLKNIAEHGQKAMTGQLLKGGAGSWVSAVKDKAVTPIVSSLGKGAAAIEKSSAGNVFMQDLTKLAAKMPKTGVTSEIIQRLIKNASLGLSHPTSEGQQ